ncbi:unnamed protein product [Pieris macdunnoughi]|uniref:Sm domain-containing protein n=1 Tax=Pieris macdunnoughi TaxID=345717 RepID=A0A821TZB2_9NEOP|nr:unnamed protein product [Pieris macdunnoughi]
MFIGKSKEKFSYHNTLLCLVKSLENKSITVDLRNDSCVCGQLTLVDGYMNLSLSNAVFCDPQGNEYLFENIFIHARNVRYVHIPQSINIITAIKQELRCNKREPRERPTAKSRKVQKAMRQHLETVKSLNVDPAMPPK